METNDSKKLVSRILDGSASEKEQQIVDRWYTGRILNNIDENTYEDLERIKREMWSSINIQKPWKSYRFGIWIKTAAAVVLVMIGLVIYRLYNNADQHAVRVLYLKDVAPAHAGATLTLSNGKRILLSAVSSGKIANTEGLTILKNTNGQIVYALDSASRKKSNGKIHTLKTAIGETYSIVLPDGTKVWLNAQSSLSFDSHIGSARIRTVELEGEGYFEVAKNKNAFIVETGLHKVEVLGTHFNINAYHPTQEIRTTLLEGAIKVSSGKGFGILKPGQQSMDKNGNIEIGDGDIETAVAWKNGYFKFDENLENIMKQIARWYDIDLIFEQNAPKNIRLWGYVSRENKLSAVLDQLSRTDKVHFKLVGKKLHIIKPE